MKGTLLCACALVLLALGCHRQADPAASSAPTAGQLTVHTEGEHTWVLGPTVIDGTNVPGSSITVRAVPNNN